MRVDLLGTPVDVLTLEETVERATSAMSSKETCVHVALNAAKFVKMRDNRELEHDVCGADIVGIDGTAIAWALELFGHRRAPRVAGVDLMYALLEHAATSGVRPFVLGAKQEILEQAVVTAKQRWPGLEFAGMRNGYFDDTEEHAIVDQIRDSDADCLFLAMPTPKKERFLAQYRDDLGVPFIMGVGGSIDVLAGHVKRAPGWVQNLGMEWSYRLLQEPRKMFWRYASTNFRFIAMVLAGRLRLFRTAR